MDIKPRIIIEWFVFAAVLVFIGITLSGRVFDFGSLQGSVTLPVRHGSYSYFTPSYGYGGFGYSYCPAQRCAYFPEELIVLDGLSFQTPEYQLEFNPPNFHWHVSPNNPSCIALEGSTEFIAANGSCRSIRLNQLRASFSAPEIAGNYIFYFVFHSPAEGEIIIGEYAVSVESPALRAADFDRNGVYDRKDLIRLFQDWNDFPQPATSAARSAGYDVTNLLTVIVSKCVDCK